MKNVPFENENCLNLFSVACVWHVRPTIHRDETVIYSIIYTIRHSIIYGRPRSRTIKYNMYIIQAAMIDTDASIIGRVL